MIKVEKCNAQNNFMKTSKGKDTRVLYDIEKLQYSNSHTPTDPPGMGV